VTGTPAPQPPSGFLDAASGEPLHPAARAAWLAAVDEGWADPSRLYREARRARLLLEAAREQAAAVVGCRADEVSFTPSGTVAAHLAVQGLAAGRSRVGSHVVASAVEHAAVLHAAESVAGEPVLVPVDGDGRVDIEAFALAVGAGGVAAACLQSANHEVGTVQPVEAVAAACAAAEVPLVVDAAQSLGRASGVPGGWTVLVGSAHKWGGPAGVGLLAVRTSARWRSPWPRDDRSADPRVPGFEDVPGIVAAVAALTAVVADAEAEDARLAALADELRVAVVGGVPDTVVLGPASDRLPHLVTFSFLYVAGEALLDELDRAGLAASSGSACTASTLEPSHVLVAMGALTHGNLRVSLPRGVRADDVHRLAGVLPGAVARVRARTGAPA
jgi:cysteine desulfurase